MLPTHGPEKRAFIYTACRKGFVNCVQFILMHGGNVDVEDDCESSPLHSAVVGGNDQIVQMLITHGVHVKKRNEDDRTPLHLAVSRKNIQNITTFLNHGVCLMLRDFEDKSAMDIARPKPNGEGCYGIEAMLYGHLIQQQRK